MLRPVDILVVFHTFLKCLRLGVHAAVDDTIKETNATNVFEFTGKALYLRIEREDRKSVVFNTNGNSY